MAEKKLKIIGFLLSVLFMFSAWAKFVSPEVFVDALKSYRLFSNEVILFLVHYVPALEVILSIFLLIPTTVRQGMLASLLLFLAFEVVLLTLLLRDIDADCGCFGKFGGTPKWAFIKNIFFVFLIFIMSCPICFCDFN